MGKFGKRIIPQLPAIPRLFSSLRGSLGVPTSVPQAESGVSPANLVISKYAFGKENEFQVLAASHIGRGHRIQASPRQDTFFVFRWGPYIVIGISDGVSASKYSHVGAEIIAENAPQLIVEILKKNLGNEENSWAALNRDLSKKLVAEYVTWKRRSLETFPEDVHLLREASADFFAATLELVVLDASENDKSEFPYLFVRVSGDGDLLLLEKSKRPAFQSVLGRVNSAKGPVGALPAFDGAPVTVTGTVERGQTLLLCTDGIGDFIGTDRNWVRRMMRISSGQGTSYSDLANFVSYSPPEAFDDQTAIFIRL